MVGFYDGWSEKEKCPLVQRRWANTGASCISGEFFRDILCIDLQAVAVSVERKRDAVLKSSGLGDFTPQGKL